MKWKKYNCFTQEVLHNENIVFYPLCRTTHVEIISADTETKLYYNDKVLSEDEAYILYRDNGQSWVKENIEVKCYAYTISTGKGFALFQNTEDFLTACAMLNVKYVIWYNARFDFSIFDYYFLTNGWTNTNILNLDRNKTRQKLKDKTYNSLNGDFGQRYQMQIWKKYINRNSIEYIHKFKMIDLCNICSGGLAKNLEDWKIEDEDGTPIRKLEMEYSIADLNNINDIQYMINDVKGLFYLSLKVNETFIRITKFSLFKGDYITTGGLAIKTMLKTMYGEDNRTNRYYFHTQFPMTPEYDKFLRNNSLYLGGKCLVNPFKLGVVQKNVFKYDVNSMYPAQMKNMLYPYGKRNVVKTINDNDKLKVILINVITGTLKQNKIPIWQNPITKEYDKVIIHNTPFLIWYEELKELEKWYDLDYDIEEVYEYKGIKCDGIIKFIDKFYRIKKQSKGCIRNGAKLILNSSYGKLAQRIDIQRGEYQLTENGYVHYVKGETEISTKSMLSVLVGSRITALARVSLMKYIREICNENVKDNFIYCDTDSVHALTEYKDTDDSELGKMKNEGTFNYALYLAPKSYLMQDYDGNYNVHCKGVNTKVVKEQLKGKTMKEAIQIFTANKTFKCLSGINCKGGKALIHIDKMILNDDDYVCNDNVLNEDGVFYEL